MASVSLKTIIDKMKLTNLTPELDIRKEQAAKKDKIQVNIWDRLSIWEKL